MKNKIKKPQPVEANVRDIPWKIPMNFANSLQFIVSINMIHVSSWSFTIALFEVQ